MKEKDEPAYPHRFTQMVQGDIAGGQVPMEIHYSGLTKREHFAGLAMQGILASCPEGIRFNPKEQRLPYEAWATSCLLMADALIKELRKGEPK